MFKHYKLKPSLPIIKDNKTKDRAGVGDKPLSPNLGRSINPIFIFSTNWIFKNQSDLI